MPRKPRQTPAGYVYHALIRATARLKLFRKAADYDAFLRVFDEALDKHPIRVLGSCLMPTHWHVVLWPAADGQLTSFLRWLTLTHSVRWHKHHHSTGSGHVYQNRFKAFAVAEGEHLLTVLRYVERNPPARRLGAARRGLALVQPGVPARGRRRSPAALAPLARSDANGPAAVYDWPSSSITKKARPAAKAETGIGISTTDIVARHTYCNRPCPWARTSSNASRSPFLANDFRTGVGPVENVVDKGSPHWPRACSHGRGQKKVPDTFY